ncbi:MAG: histidine kinase [bacterium]|nr:histidine kinase [bacterium]
MREKTYSLKKTVAVIWAFLSVFLGGALLFYGGYSVWKYRDYYQEANRIVAENYAAELNKSLESLKAYVDGVYSENVHYRATCRSNLTEMEWIQATYYLANSFYSKASNIEYFGGVFFYERDKDMLRSAFSEYEYEGDAFRLNVAIKDFMREKREDREGVFTFSGETYLCYSIGRRDKYVGFVLNLSRYYEPERNMQLLVTDQEGNVLADAGSRILEKEAIAGLREERGPKQADISYQMAGEPLDYGGLSIIVVRPLDYLKFWKQWEFWLLVILLPLITLICLLIVYRMLNQVLLQPVNYLMERITKRKRGEPVELQEERRERIQEYRVINRRLDELVDELAQLEEEKYRKEREAAAALLQYYQLQINPHFFLNCLNIVDSLADRNNTANIKVMIHALSRHFRYVFQDGQKLVSVREELEEAKAYCDIYRIKGGLPILLKIRAEEELMEYRVPILCVQTFVENSVKYAFRDGQILSLEVTADIVPDGEGRYLRIRIEDNGEGYPPEKLPGLNRPVTQFKYHSEHVGIDNIKYRTFILYGEKARICFYNNPSGGAVTELLLPEVKDYESVDHR